MKRFKQANQIKVGVIGYGGAFNMGKQHLSQMKQAGMTPYAVCEIAPERIKQAQEDFPGIETYDSLDKMLKQSDVNLLTHITPHNLHYPLAAKCLKAGKHVVTEKPFVITTAEADKLIKLSEKHKVMVSTYHNRHWDGWILRAVDQVVEKKVIGDVFKVDIHMGGYGMPREWWRTSKTISGGVLYDWGVHLLEYTLQVIQSEITEVSGFAKQGYWASQMSKKHPFKNDCNEDDATAIVRFKNGAMAQLYVSNLRADSPPYQMKIHGTKGAYLIHFQEGWTLLKPNRKGEIVSKTGKHFPSKGHLFYQNIADYLTGKAKLIITPQWARRPIHILDLANRSIAQGKALKAKYG